MDPFAGLPSSVKSNKERQAYVDLDSFAKVLAKAPNARWRALLVLARIGAFRIPSEAQGLKWDHIAWEAKRISIVGSSKTEHHAKRQIRIVPLLPAIEKELLALFAEAPDGAEYVFPDIDGTSNLRTTLEKIITRAGVKQWPKLWQNLRASGCTDFARSLPPTLQRLSVATRSKSPRSTIGLLPIPTWIPRCERCPQYPK